MAKLLKKIKNNPFVRGLYFIYKSYFGIRRSMFTYCADNVVITPPVYRQSKECFLVRELQFKREHQDFGIKRKI